MLKIAVSCSLFDGTIEKRRGTGFLISRDGHVLTTYHLIGDPEECKTLEISGSIRNVDDLWTYDTTLEVVPIESNYDVILLKVQKPLSSEPIGLRSGEQPRIPEDFLFLTYSLSPEVAAAPSSVRAKQTEGIWQTNHAFNPADSGAPVLDTEGRAIGVVLGRVKDANFGAGPVNVQQVGWMISTVPAINEVVAGASVGKSTISVTDKTAQPGYAVLSFDISLVPDRVPVTEVCRPGRACLPVDEDGAPAARSISRPINVPFNSVISRSVFEGIKRGGNVQLDIRQDHSAATMNAQVSASESAFVSGKLTVFFDPVVIQMAYPVNLVLHGSDAQSLNKVLQAEEGYKIVTAEFRPQAMSRAESPRIAVAASGTSLEFSAAVTAVPGADNQSAEVHGLILTRQERIRDASPR